MKETQCDKLLEVLRDHQPHSSLNLRNDLFIVDIPTRIWDLKHRGYNIKTEMLPNNPKDIKSAPVAYYRLVPDNKQEGLGLDLPRIYG